MAAWKFFFMDNQNWPQPGVAADESKGMQFQPQPGFRLGSVLGRPWAFVRLLVALLWP